MYARRCILSCYCVKVTEQLVCIKWCYRCDETAEGVETGVECLIGAQFVGCHFACPETRFVQTDVPVRQEVDDESLDESSGWCRVEVVEVGLNVLHEVVQLAEQPAVEVRTVCVGDVGFLVFETVDIGIHSEEGVGLLQFDEERTGHFLYSLRVE